jgi:hypothetical protein
MGKSKKILVAGFFLLTLCFFVQANEKQNESKEKINFSFTSNNDGLTKSSFSPNAVTDFAARAKNGGGVNTKTALVASGVGLLLSGIVSVGFGIPIDYLNAIGLGLVTYHPGIVKVVPFDGNMMWIYLGYGFGVGLIALGSLLIVAGTILIIVGAVLKGSFAKVYIENDSSSSKVGISFKL